MIQSVARAISILKAFSREEPEIGISELSRRLKLHKSVVHRLAATLEQEGFLVQNQTTGKYRIGMRAFEVGVLYIAEGSIGELAMPILQDVARRTNYTARLCVRDGGSVVVLASVEGKGFVRAVSALGLRFPLHVTSAGKVLMAYLPPSELDQLLKTLDLEPFTSQSITNEIELKRQLSEIRQNGYGINLEEMHRGLGSVAAPAFDRSGQIAGSVCLAFPAQSIDASELETLGLEVKDAAAELSRRLGARNVLRIA